MKILILILTFVMNFPSASLVWANPPSEQTNQKDQKSRMIVHLLDYLAQDYGEAVADSGEILSQFEYEEQIEFVVNVRQTAQELSLLQDHPSLLQKIDQLEKMIKTPLPPLQVTPLAREIKKEIIQVAEIKMTPLQWPDMAHGKQIFQSNCISCHGQEGRGDGPDGVGMEPAPANFWNDERMSNLSPFQAFNTIKLGVPGTGMPSFDTFSDQEIWNLAFYLMAIRHSHSHSSSQALPLPSSSPFTLDELASLSDNDLKQSLRNKKTNDRVHDSNSKNNSDSEQEAYLAGLIQKARTEGGNGPEGNSVSVKKTELAQQLVKEASEAFQQGQFDQAQQLALNAYLQGIEPIEPLIKVKNPQLLLKIEQEMMQWRHHLKSQQHQDVALYSQQILTTLGEIENLLGQKEEISPWINFSLSLGIVLRESLEAILIILAILGVVRTTGQRKALFYVHGGWMGAVLLGVVAWFFSGKVLQMSGTSRELLESLSSLLAVVILVYIGLWLHRKSEAKRWNEFIQQKTGKALSSGKMMSLAAVSFLAVFREALETVLFLRTLWLEEGVQKTAILSGVAAAFILILVLAWPLMKMKFLQKLPLKTVFRFSSLALLFMAFILMGKGIYALQEAGLLTMTPLPFDLTINILGFYPTLETLLAQAALILVCLLFIWMNQNSTIKTATLPSSD